MKKLRPAHPGPCMTPPQPGDSKPAQQVQRLPGNDGQSSLQADVCATQLSLPTLPIDVLEAVCAWLSLQDRISLASCCRALLARADVSASQVLWGDIKARWQLQGVQKQPLLRKLLGRLRIGRAPTARGGRGQPPLAAWLERHLDGLRALRLTLGGEADAQAVARTLAHASRLTHLELAFDSTDMDRIPPCLASLPPAALVALKAPWCQGIGAGGASALAALRHCTALTYLELCGCGLQRLPAELLSSLPALAKLDISHNDELQCGSALELACLTALTRLKLQTTPIRCLPEQLAVLPCLRALELEGSQHLQKGQEADWVPLGTRLLSLRLSALQLAALPPRLSVLAGLEELILEALGHFAPPDAHRTALDPLQHLTALTRLSLRFCRTLTSFPPQLSALSRLAYLDIMSSDNMGRAEGEAGFQPLRHLTTLTRLELFYAGLKVVPPQLSACTRLAHLSLGRNYFRTELPGCLQPLGHLHGLTYLDFSVCTLRQVPAELSACTALLRLELTGNEFLGSSGSEDAFEALRRLASLTALSLRSCALQRLPAQLAACTALKELDVRDNGAGRWGEAALEPLRRLTALAVLYVATNDGQEGQQAWPDGPPPLLRSLVARGLVLRQ